MHLKMSVAVILEYFFTDHREKALIGVSKYIKTIADLQNRIKELFKIGNIYLMRDDLYLHPDESIEVLNSADTVCAYPLDDQPELERKKKSASVKTQADKVDAEGKKKKKRKHLDSDDYDDGIEIPPLHLTKAKRLKIKDKQSKSSISETNGTESTSGTSSENDNTMVAEETSETPTTNNKINTNRVKTLVTSFEQHLLYKKFLEHKQNSTNNIVKTVICSNNPHMPNSSTPLGEIQQTGDPETPISPIETPDEKEDTVNKEVATKRKRVRKRKHNKSRNAKEDLDTPHCPPPHTLVPRPLLTKWRPAKHVRFSDEFDDTLKDNITQPGSDYQTNNAKIEIISNDIISQKNNIDNMSVIKEDTVMKESDYFNEDFISKQPITNAIKPKVGDLIAFKTLRISESYCPVVSSNVVGKVVSFIEETCDVLFDVIYGLDQCLEPQGKFSLEQDPEDPDAEPSKDISIINYGWKNLIEPRLLNSTAANVLQ